MSGDLRNEAISSCGSIGEPGLLPGSLQRPASCGRGAIGGAGWGREMWAQELPHLGSWLQDKNEGESPALLVMGPLRFPRRREEAPEAGGQELSVHPSCPGRSPGWILRFLTRAGRKTCGVRNVGAVSWDTAPRPGWDQSTGPFCFGGTWHRIGADALTPRGDLLWGQEPSRSLHRCPGAKEQI